MEGDKRELEADSRDYKCESHNKQSAHLGTGDRRTDIVEVERATRQRVDERQTHEKHSRGENSGDDILESSLMTLIMLLVERHHCGERQRRRLQANHEKKEVTGRNHKEHPEKSHKQKFIELALADCHLIALHPFG